MLPILPFNHFPEYCNDIRVIAVRVGYESWLKLMAHQTDIVVSIGKNQKQGTPLQQFLKRNKRFQIAMAAGKKNRQIEKFQWTSECLMKFLDTFAQDGDIDPRNVKNRSFEVGCIPAPCIRYGQQYIHI
jgi:hypothetical protein